MYVCQTLLLKEKGVDVSFSALQRVSLFAPSSLLLDHLLPPPSAPTAAHGWDTSRALSFRTNWAAPPSAQPTSQAEAADWFSLFNLSLSPTSAAAAVPPQSPTSSPPFPVSLSVSVTDRAHLAQSSKETPPLKLVPAGIGRQTGTLWTAKKKKRNEWGYFTQLITPQINTFKKKLKLKTKLSMGRHEEHD